MVASLIKKDADTAIVDDNQNKNLKSEYQANRNFILSEVLKKITTMLSKPISGKRILEDILKKSKKIRSQIRPNRNCERKSIIPKGNLAYKLAKTKNSQTLTFTSKFINYTIF